MPTKSDGQRNHDMSRMMTTAFICAVLLNLSGCSERRSVAPIESTPPSTSESESTTNNDTQDVVDEN